MTGWLFLILFGGVADASKVPVYRTPESVFHSGHAQHSVLKKNTKSIRDVQWTQVHWRGKEGWIQQRDLLSPTDFLGPNGKYKIAFSHHNAIFYATPELTAKVHLLLDGGTPLKVLGRVDSWLHLEMGKLRGYVLTEQLITDRALAGTKNKILTIADGVNLYSKPAPKGAKIAEIPGGELLERKRTESVPWGLAELSDLGEVWWPMQEGQIRAPVKIATDLSKRPIFDMITLPSLKNEKIISADGIYRSTKNGWKKLEQFGDDNHPLAVTADGTLFVGSFLSRDGGKTFRPYINWQNFLKPLPENNLMHVRLQSIEILDAGGKELQIQVETHKKKYQLYSRDSGKTWNLIR